MGESTALPFQHRSSAPAVEIPQTTQRPAADRAWRDRAAREMGRLEKRGVWGIPKNVGIWRGYGGCPMTQVVLRAG